METQCRCGRPIMRARFGNHEMILDAEPNIQAGQVLVILGNAYVLNGKPLGDARAMHLNLHTRHGVTCSHFWKREN